LSGAVDPREGEVRWRANMTILGQFNSVNIIRRAVSANIYFWQRRVHLVEPMPAEGGIVTPSMERRNSQSLLGCYGDLAGWLAHPSIKEPIDSKVRRMMFLLSVAVVLAGLSLTARPQSMLSSGDASGAVAITPSRQLDLTYVRPTQRIMVRNYAFDAFGPYPIAGAAVVAGINQISNAPPEWNQGVAGYSRRFGSDYGIALVATTTRYGLSEALREDAMYYRCECRGAFPRLSHALISTFTARRGDDGHRVFSLPALLGPYAGSMTAVYGWYPSRYGAKDAFRTGNYSLLLYAGGNVALEFLYSGPHSLLSRMHLNNAHGSPEPGPNH
jgi:hypothetical protein